MEKHSSPQCVIFHVYAEDNEGPEEKRWKRIIEKYPSIQRSHIKSYFDQNPDFAHGRYVDLESNAESWPSYSQFMIELDADPDALKFSDLQNDRKHRVYDFEQLSGLKSRDHQRDISLFKWHQPVQRVATIVEIIDFGLHDVRSWANLTFGIFIEVQAETQSYIAIVPPFVQAIEARLGNYLNQE